MKHYRVDKMQRIELTEEKRTGESEFDKFDLARFVKSTFGCVSHEVAVSGQFFGWVVGLGARVKIIGPDHVAREFRDWSDNIRNKL